MKSTLSGIIQLRALARKTTAAIQGNHRLDRIRAAQRAIERSPHVERLLLDYTDAVFRHTESLMAAIGATAN